MTTLRGRLAATASVLAVCASLLVGAPAQAADPVVLNLLGINDFHGRIDNNTVKFAGTIEQLRAGAGDANTLLVSAGDNVGASVFASSTQGDIPTIDVLNALDLDASATGNHEFDRGYDDLVDRLQPAADFPILGANVFKAGGERALDPYEILTVDGLDVAVVGAVTQETPSLVSPAGIQGLTFADPAASINDAVDELGALADPPDVIVASYHEGAPDGTQTYQQAIAASQAFKNLAENTSPEVDAIFMGHTHQAYVYDAPVPGQAGTTRPIVQTGSYGANIGQIQLTVDPDTGDVQAHTQRNVARTAAADDALISTYPRVAEVDGIVDAALAYADEVGSEPIGTVTADITTAFTGPAPTDRDDRASESTLGDLVADALLAKVSEVPAGEGVDLGIVNPGGLRADLYYEGTGGTNTDGVVTRAEAISVLPFTNNLSAVTLTGTQLKTVLEQQWQRDAQGNIPSRPYLQLGLSENATYTFDPTRPEGDRITSVRINGSLIDPDASYKVATFSFLATGGDNFRAFTQGTNADTGLVDYQAWIEYLADNSPVSPDFARQAVQVEGLQDTYPAGGEVSFTLPKLDLTSRGSPANTSVAVSLRQGDEVTDLGDFDVTDGAAAPSFTLPSGASGDATIRVVATPSGTTADLPITIESAPQADADVRATTPRVIRQGSQTFVRVRVKGPDGRATGTVAVREGDTELGSAQLERGRAFVRVDSRSFDVGRHTLTVDYSGDDTYGPAADEVTVRVIKRRR